MNSITRKLTLGRCSTNSAGSMSVYELALLYACHEVILRTQEMVPLLAQTLGVQPREVFYHWVIDREVMYGEIGGTAWQYAFHGLECDLMHQGDGRFLRVEFGPGGRFDLISPWSLLQFIMTTKTPWLEFPELQEYLAARPSPYDHLSGSYAKICDLWKRIDALGYVEVVSPELCALNEKYTTIDAQGIRWTSLPDEFNHWENPMFWDLMVCQRLVLSELGKKVSGEE